MDIRGQRLRPQVVPLPPSSTVYTSSFVPAYSLLRALATSFTIWAAQRPQVQHRMKPPPRCHRRVWIQISIKAVILARSMMTFSRLFSVTSIRMTTDIRERALALRESVVLGTSPRHARYGAYDPSSFSTSTVFSSPIRAYHGVRPSTTGGR